MGDENQDCRCWCSAAMAGYNSRWRSVSWSSLIRVVLRILMINIGGISDLTDCRILETATEQSNWVPSWRSVSWNPCSLLLKFGQLGLISALLLFFRSELVEGKKVKLVRVAKDRLALLRRKGLRGPDISLNWNNHYFRGQGSVGFRFKVLGLGRSEIYFTVRLTRRWVGNHFPGPLSGRLTWNW